MRRQLASFLLVLLLLPAVARAQKAKPPEFIGVRVGFADRYKAGLWTPVELTLRGGTEALVGSVRVSVADSDGVPCWTTTPEPATQVLPGRDTTVIVYARFGHVRSSLRAEFRWGKGLVVERTFDVSAEDYLEAVEGRGLVVQVSRGSLGLEEAAGLAKLGGEARAIIARVDDVARLPTRWYGYEGVDAVVLSTSQADVFKKLMAESARVEALDEWIRMGGKLVLCVGSQGDAMLRADSPLARFAPGRFAGVLSLHQTAALEAYAKSQNPVPRSGPAQSSALRVARLSDVQGKVEAAESDLPLVVRTPRGFGQVIFFAADLDRSLLARWSDRKLLVARLLDWPATEAPTEENNFGMRYGFGDLSGQLRSALDRFTGVRLVPFGAVALLVVLYILWIGPGDYFFLRKFVRRMEWTWFTFPAIVLATSGGAYFMAYRLKGDQLRVNQVDLVDVDAAGSVRGTSWMNVFSPRMEAFNLSLAPRFCDGRPAEPRSMMISWMGLAGDGIGGMHQQGGSMLWSGQYSASPGLDAIDQVPIQVWSTKSFTGRWTAASKGCPIDASLTDEGRAPRGTVTSRLDFPLSYCVLAYDRCLYDLGTLEPGQPVDIGSATRCTDLGELMKGSAEQLFAKQAAGSPYDQSSVNVPYIVRAMTFFDAADGRRQSRLANDYQQFVDLSGQLAAGRAVLLAYPVKSEQHPGAELLRDGRPIYGSQDRRTTIYRFVLPVGNNAKPQAAPNPEIPKSPNPS